jgi:hypothetical protein
MSRTLILLCFFVPFSSTAQEYLDKSKKDLKKALEKYSVENKAQQPIISESDSTVILTIKNDRSQEISYTYSFDKKGTTTGERVKAGSDSTIKEALKSVLNKKEYQWKKINGNQYISRFADRLLLELPVEPSQYWFTIYKANWTKEIYDILVKE